MTRAGFERARELVEQGIPVAVATVIRGDGLGSKIIVLQDSVEGTLGLRDLDDQVALDGRELLAAERSETRSYGEWEIFLDVYPPPPHLVIFGAVHVAQALSNFAQALGFQVTVVDARRALATRTRFPNVEKIITLWPDDAYEQLSVGPNTWIAILTHDPKFDEPALLGALKTEARYIGAIGSRKTNVDRRERLSAAGVSDEVLARVRGPIGLDIGGQTPEEMAIAILAEMIAVRYGRSGGFLVHSQGNIRGDAG